MKIGVMVNLSERIFEDFRKLNEYGISTCQVVSWQPALFTPRMAEVVRSASAALGIEVTAFWCGWEGPHTWNFTEGPVTLGIVPPAYRFQRMQNLLLGAEFAAQLGVKDLITHVGYIPENMTDPEYPAIVAALRYLARHCQGLGLHFLFETGQETPVVLLRVIEDVGFANLGVNLDTANLILYGKANPVDALDVIGRYVRGVHAKDGLYPTNGRELGKETPLGQGKVDFRKVIARLKELGYDGALTIEREITGDQQVKDILAGKALLEKILEEQS
jgi:sugar phosphate isomerase/epimerase